MPEVIIRGVPINYRVIGDRGSWVAFTPGSRRGYEELIPLAQAIAEAGHRVLLHDRRNCGASGVSIENTGSEHEIWADDLDALCRSLGIERIYAGGSSAGARLALLFALRHPDMVCGLLLWRVTGGRHAVEKLSHQYYTTYEELAREGGMEAVCQSEHFAECIEARPSNRDRLMDMKVEDFLATMAMWRSRFLSDADLPVVGATEEQLRALAAPACIASGNDKTHTPETARKVAGLIPNSELHDDLVSKRGEGDLLETWDQAEWKVAEPRLAAIFNQFLRVMDARG